MFDYDGAILGYDCDGREIEEFRVLRFPFSADVDNWEEVMNVDPRFYCIVKLKDNHCYAVSIYDDYSDKYIRRYENIPDDEQIPLSIRSVSDMCGYEVAFNGITGCEWFYDRNRNELKKEVERNLNYKKLIKK